ncbi:hypothetical protein ACFOU2_20525 [Bacillus songklensis]|uniref:Uncharacterized protein n=1 Tax=Bacillus songklensis TaxID=1069116 RepID=A0ABV8B6E5_9BACI
MIKLKLLKKLRIKRREKAREIAVRAQKLVERSRKEERKISS